MADPIWLQKLKNALSGSSRRPTYSVSGVEPATSAVSPNMYHQRFSEGSFGDMPNIGYAAAGKPTVQYHTPMAGKKGLSMKNMINAMSKLKSPTGKDFGKAGGRVGGARPSGGDPLTGLSATYPYTGVTKPSNEAIERLRKWGY
jgi:hypothetical protein